MTFAGWLMAFAGVGLVLTGLRTGIRALDTTLVEKIQGAVVASSRTPARALATGLVATTGLQASSITVVGAMALLQQRVCTLPQAMYLMLGATIGTTIKAWTFVLPWQMLGPMLVGLASAGLVLVRRLTRRRILEVGVAGGLLYLGWALVGQHLGPLLETETVQGWLMALHVRTLPGLMVAIAAGFVLTALVQSSSLVVFFTIALVSTGILELPVAAAVVLGANVGTAVMPLYASLEYRAEVRVLAFAHLFVKAVGAALVGLFFHAYLGLVGLVVSVFGVADQPALQVAAAHTVFNVINVAVWAPFVPFMARTLARREPDGIDLTLTRPVRRILARLPGEALENIDSEIELSLRSLKVALDEMWDALPREDTAEPPDRRALGARLRGTRELLAIVLARHPGRSDLHRRTRVISAMQEMLVSVMRIEDELSRQSSRNRRLRARVLGKRIPELATHTDALWHRMLADGDEPVDAPWFASFEASVLAGAGESRSEAEILAMDGVLAPLRHIWWHLVDLADCLEDLDALNGESTDPEQETA